MTLAWAFATTFPVVQILLSYSNLFKFPDVDMTFLQIINEQTKRLSCKLIVIVNQTRIIIVNQILSDLGHASTGI